MSSPESSRRLTVALIVKDMSAALSETLASIQNIADEILVADTGSSDDSVAMAESRGAQVIHHAWTDSFAEARNALLPHATGDWILWLDAGETLATPDARELKQYLTQEARPDTAYALLIHVPEQGTAIAAEEAARVRLHPRREPLRFEGRVCESLLPGLGRCGMTVEGLPWRIHRSLREHDPRRKAERALRNARLAEIELQERGMQPELLNCIGEALHALGDAHRAAQFFHQAMVHSEPASDAMLEAYYGLLTAMDEHPQQAELQVQLCLKALEIFPLDAQLLCAMGNYMHGMQRLDLAARAFESAYRFGRVPPQVWHLVEIQEIALCCLSLVLQQQNKDEEALRLMHEALRNAPESLRLHRRLLEFHIQRGQRDHALACIGKMPKRMAKRDALRNVVRGACLAQQGHWIAAKAYLQTAYQAGCREAVCLRWFLTALTACGEPERALEILREWETWDPKNHEVGQYKQILQQRAEKLPRDGKVLRVDAPAPSSPSGHTLPAVPWPLAEALRASH